MVLHTGKYEELIVCSHEIAASTAQLVAASKVSLPSGSWAPDHGGGTTCGGETVGMRVVQPAGRPAPPPQVKADKHSPHLSRLQECSRAVNEMAASVVASTRSGQEQIEDRGECWGPGAAAGLGAGAQTLTHSPLAADTMDFSGLSLIKLKKQEMETQVGALGCPSPVPPPTPVPRPRLSSGKAGGPLGRGRGPAERLHTGLQVRVLELEKTLEVERVRLGELRKQHYMLAGAVGTPGADEPGRPSAAPRGGTSKKPPLAQKPSVAPRQDQQVRGVSAGGGGGDSRGAPGVLSQPLLTGLWGSGPWGRSEATDQWGQTRGPSNAGSTAGAKASCQGRGRGQGAAGCLGPGPRYVRHSWPWPPSPSPLTSCSLTKRMAATRLHSSTTSHHPPARGVQRGG